MERKYSIFLMFLGVFMFNISKIGGTSKKTACHSECKCVKNNSELDLKLDITCLRGGLDDKSLHSLLSKLSKQATSLKIIGPWFRPNNFSITLQFLRFKKLQELQLVNCGLKTLGKRVFANLRGLRVLNVQQNRISSVSVETFENTGQIEILDLAQNYLQHGYLPTGAFSYLKRLKSLSLADNAIKEFPRNLLLGLRNLEVLVLDGNQLNNFALTQLLTDVPQLTRLSMNKCGIRDISPACLASVSDLKSLEFGFNRFGRIPILALKKLPKLESLSLAGNNISIVPPFAFHGLSELAKISLAHNSLGSCYDQSVSKTKYGIDPMAFHNLTLIELDLSYNHYATFRSSQVGLARESLRILHLTGNPLQEIRAEQIENLKLEGLHLANVGLTSLPITLPSEYRQLSLLNLSQNALLDSIPPSTASILSKHLTTLDISSCNFSYFPKYFYHFIFDRLETVFLHQNPLDCHCHIMSLKEHLLDVKRRNRCAEFHLSKIRCASPKEFKDTLVIKVEKPPDCSVIFGASSGLTHQSELGILIASVCGILLLLALIITLICWSRTWGVKGTYRTREDSKGHLSTSGSEVSGDSSLNPAAEPQTERLF